MTTDTSENGLEQLIVAAMTTPPPTAYTANSDIADTQLRAPSCWLTGNPQDYLREYALDLLQLQLFLQATQPTLVEARLFINGLPVFTFELKNSLTKQTAEDAVEQYKRDRDPKELLFQFGRCIAHFSVDDHEARFCTELKAPRSKDKQAGVAGDSWFLPFNVGWNDGAGNPPNPHGLKTAYLWKRILTPASLSNILENYAQVVTPKDEKTGKKKKPVQIFPRYHQLDVVRQLLADVKQNGVGQRYLIQHSAGSGKSNSIAWLAHQLVNVQRDGQRVFDSIIVLTDRRILDQQIADTIRQFMQVNATVGHAGRSGSLRQFIEAGKPIIVSTIQKFPVILKEIGELHRGRNFAIIIDEAHSSQGGKASAAVSETLSDESAHDPENTINDALEQRMVSRKMLGNASYFAFTATPKPKTLELFGIPYQGENGETIEDDPAFDSNRARKKLKRYVESHDHAIRLKAEIIRKTDRITPLVFAVTALLKPFAGSS
jgi:type I restriction enzyme R subunit